MQKLNAKLTPLVAAKKMKKSQRKIVWRTRGRDSSMSALSITLKRIAKLGLILMMGVSMNASAGLFGLGGTSWKEEVLLHDGQIIIIKRSQTRGGRHEIGQPPPVKEHTISFTLPNSNNAITWTSEYGEDVGRANFDLLAVHVLNGTPYIVASPNLCLSYNKWGRPNPPYVFFKYSGKVWQRIPLSEFPSEFKTINVAVSTLGDEDKLASLGFVSAEKIKELNSEYKQPEYRTILREPLRPQQDSQTSCPIPSNAAAKPIAPEIDGKPLYYNWWPLAQDWLNKTYGGKK